MKKLLLLLFITFCSTQLFAQNINNSIQNTPHLETTASVDTLVVPDRIFLTIHLKEKDSKGKVSIEELESRMEKALIAANVNIDKQLSLFDFGSDFSKYFLRGKDVSKEKKYKLVLFNTKEVADVLLKIEKIKISNVSFYKVEYSKEKELKLALRQQAVKKAQTQAQHLVKPLNQKIGKAIYISDTNNIVNYDYSNNLRRVSNKLNFSNNSNVQFRKIRISLSVNVKFQLY